MLDEHHGGFQTYNMYKIGPANDIVYPQFFFLATRNNLVLSCHPEDAGHQV
jgi:hypothetical protein